MIFRSGHLLSHIQQVLRFQCPKQGGREEDLVKKVSIYFCHCYSGARLSEVGDRFGISDAAITQASKRIRVAAELDRNLRESLIR